MTGSSRTNLMKASSPDFRYFLRFSMRSCSLPSQIIPDNVRLMPRAARPLLLLAALASPAAAEVHATLAAGGALRFDAPSFGAWAAAELWPGGLWGARVDVHATDGPLLIEGSVARALGATWRHLVVSVHAGGGADLDRQGVAVAAGFATELGLFIGP